MRDPACRPGPGGLQWGSSLGPAQQEGQPPCLRGSIDRAPGSPAAARPSESPEGRLPGRQQSFSLRARGSLSYSVSSCPETAPNPPRWASAEPRRGGGSAHAALGQWSKHSAGFPGGPPPPPRPREGPAGSRGDPGMEQSPSSRLNGVNRCRAWRWALAAENSPHSRPAWAAGLRAPLQASGLVITQAA